ncbi:MAG: B12-binding domain-containing protein [Dissulfuribacterales bacterium]
MVTSERKQEILKNLNDAVVNYDEEKSVAVSKLAIEEGVDAYDAIMNGLCTGMEKVGELFSSSEYFVPEVLLCSDALYAGLEILRPHIQVGSQQIKMKVVIGTVEGDIHDIGKNLVKIMFDGAGWAVHDLGKDVKIEKFDEVQKTVNADLVALSALMTTSMLAMPEIIKRIKKRDASIPVIVGGAPLNMNIAKSYGADGYASDAVQAIREATKLVEAAKKQSGK